VEIDLYFIHERVATSDVHVLNVPTMLQFTDIFTKGLSSIVFLSVQVKVEDYGMLATSLGFWISPHVFTYIPMYKGLGLSTLSILIHSQLWAILHLTLRYFVWDRSLLQRLLLVDKLHLPNSFTVTTSM
jgi:hypothetical protein